MLLSLLHLKSSHCSSNIVPFHVIQFYRGFQDTIPDLDSYFLFSVDSSGFTPWVTVSSRFILWLHAYAFSIKASFFKLKGKDVGTEKRREAICQSCKTDHSQGRKKENVVVKI